MTSRFIAALALALTLLAAAPPALAQGERSPNDLRVENDRLKERIEELESQLDAARRRIDSMSETINRLREQLRNRDAGPDGGDAPGSDDGAGSPPQRETAPVPDDPFAAPAAMLASLRESYDERFGSRDIGAGRERDEYLRDVRLWSRQASRDSRGQIEWPVRVVDVLEEDGPRQVFLIEVVDRSSGLPVGEPFEIEVLGRNAVRLREVVGEVWILDGVLRGEARVDERATSEDAATGEGAYIGPFALFTYEVAVRSVRPDA